ncbi:MAG: chemotaxis protein CheW [Nitrospiraceae bacterium]
MVDEILGQQQVVIKSMEQNFRKAEGVAGATILGNGTVGFILDVRGVLDIARRGAAAAA